MWIRKSNLSKPFLPLRSRLELVTTTQQKYYEEGMTDLIWKLCRKTQCPCYISEYALEVYYQNSAPLS